MTQAIALHAEEGKAIWMLNHLMTFKATSGQTGGAFALVEQIGEPGTGAPPHVHHNEDEFFFVLEGEAIVGHQRGCAFSETEVLERVQPGGVK